MRKNSCVARDARIVHKHAHLAELLARSLHEARRRIEARNIGLNGRRLHAKSLAQARRHLGGRSALPACEWFTATL